MASSAPSEWFVHQDCACCLSACWSCVLTNTIKQYIWSNSDHWGNFSKIWDQWPARNVSGLMKWYLLVQLAFWAQQLLVINIEERRKDHYQMLTHHVITIALFGSAYVYGFYNVSNVVLSLMDIVDLLLPVRSRCSLDLHPRSKSNSLTHWVRRPRFSSI